MFTGIIESTAAILQKSDTGLTLERPAIFDDVKIGSSINISGVCLSIVELTPSSMRFDVVPETLAKTTINNWEKGDRVNLERAMKASDRLDGHVVQGHVEGVGEVMRSGSDSGTGSMLQILVSDQRVPFIVKKGSIAIDGVSLTIADIDGDMVTVALIPHTLENTTLGSLKEGDCVNIETDVLLRR